QARAANHVELEPLARHHARLDAGFGARKRHARVDEPLQLPSDGNAGIQMAAGSAARDNHCHASRHPGAVPCCETLSRMPMPIRLISSDDPPALTNGSGIPLFGTRPRTTLML